MTRRPPISPLFPNTTLFRSDRALVPRLGGPLLGGWRRRARSDPPRQAAKLRGQASPGDSEEASAAATTVVSLDRKSTRLNSSHSQISYAVFCLKKKRAVQQS